MMASCIDSSDLTFPSCFLPCQIPFYCRVSAMATLHLELIAAVPKRHIMTANEFLWPQTTMIEKDSHTISVWVTISNAVWGWSKYWVCYWICNSDGIMEYDFPFSCGAPTTEYWSMNYASSIIYVFARSDLINFCQAHNEVVICSIVTNVLCAVAPVWMNRDCAKPWPKDTNKCRSGGTITYFLGPSLPHSATIAKRIESVKL
jgi:hypothetical protein